MYTIYKKIMKKSVSIRIHVEAKNKLVLLSKNAEKSQTDYISRAFEFIYNSGLDIYKKSGVNIPDAVKNLERRIIGFMKKRESDFFIPMNEKVKALTYNHIKLFDALEALDVVSYASHKSHDIAPLVTKSSSSSEELETYKEQNEAEKQQIELKLAKAKRQAEIFKDELEFLMNNISKAGALSKSKFTLNITQRDCQRIRTLLDDN